MKNMKNKAFTLVELLVVVLILGILTAIALPNYLLSVEKGRVVEAQNNLSSIAKAEQLIKLSNGSYTSQIDSLDISLNDVNGEKVIGDQFNTKDFHFTVYGSEEGAATAQRIHVSEDKQYTLAIDYMTGKIFCRPVDNRVCRALNLEEGPAYGSENISWQSCNGNYGRFEYMFWADCLMYQSGGKTYRKYCDEEYDYCVFATENEDGSYETEELFCRGDLNEDGTCDNIDSRSKESWNGPYGSRFSSSSDGTGSVDEYYCKGYVCYTTAAKSCETDSQGECVEYTYLDEFVVDENGKQLAQKNCQEINSDGTCAKYHICDPHNSSNACEQYRDSCPETPTGTCCLSFRHYLRDGTIVYHNTKAEALSACQDLYGTCSYWWCGYSGR